MALKRAGRGHDPSGIEATSRGELMVECPACPHPDRNLPDGWQSAGPLLYVFPPLNGLLSSLHIRNPGFYIFSFSLSMGTSNSKAKNGISTT
jgi:hypothetical protein